MIYMLVSIVVLGLSVSADSFGIGLTYGMRKIHTPFRSLMVIMLCTSMAMFFSMSIGKNISLLISPYSAQLIGGFLLIGIGSFSIYNLYKNNKDIKEKNNKKNDKPFRLKFEIKKIRIVIEILKSPASADADQSGNISIKEALFLGLAVSLDAFGAGLGASLLGYPVIVTSLIIGGMSGIFIYMGTLIGTRFSEIKIINKLKFLPGLLLIIIGLSTILS